MKYLFFLFGILLSVHAFAEPPSTIVPLNQNLTAVDYAREGRQTGCGLRVTGETEGDLWVNVLLSVFLKDSGTTLGMFKVVVKKINLQNGEPLTQDGKLAYSSIGKIQQAWIKTATGVQLKPYENGAASHGDGYMTSLEFGNALDLLVAIPQASFQVGINKSAGGSDEVFEFHKSMARDEADKLSSCMKNLRGAIEEKENGKSF